MSSWLNKTNAALLGGLAGLICWLTWLMAKEVTWEAAKPMVIAWLIGAVLSRVAWGWWRGRP